MTEEEKTLLINEIVDYLISHSQSVEGIPVQENLDGVSSFPAIKEILNEESQVVRVSLDSILPEFRYYNGYVQYRFSSGNWINLFQVSTSLDGYATKDYVDLKVSEVISNAPVTLNTLNKIAAALNYDPSFYQNIYQAINTKWTTNPVKIANWDQAFIDRHVHDNISSLNLITDILVGKWNEAYSWGDHSVAGYEHGLGNPLSNGQILSSNTDGTRSWVDQYIHPQSTVVPGIYTKVTVDLNGHVTYGSGLSQTDIPSISWNQVPFDRPTTLLGYGITDAYTKNYIDKYLQRKYSGVVDIGEILLNENTVTVPASKVNLYSNSKFEGYISEYEIAEKTFTITGTDVKYIVVSYNNGSPEYIITQERSMINYSNVIPIITLIYDGVKIHSVNWDEQANGLSERLLKRLNRTQRFQRDGGLLINVDGSRTITISQSTIYFGASEVVYPSSSSSTNLIYQYHHSDGVWTYTRSQFLNNLEYDNGTDLASLSNDNRYTINWVYAGVGDDGDIITVLGTGDYKLDEVINAQPPSILPDIIRFHGILVGKVIYKKGLNTPYQVISISEQSISAGGTVVEHNNLNGLQGGNLEEFYHLSHSEYLNAQDSLSFSSTPGTYRSVTTDSKGRIISGTNPTTLSEYGISDEDVTNSLLTGYALGQNTEVSSTDSIIGAIGKLQAYINARQGTVTSVGVSVPLGFTVLNSPITTNGVIGIGYTEGYSLPSNSIQSNWSSAYNYSLIGHLPLTGGNLSGNLGITGDLNISGNIYQSGSVYETHAENIYSKNDYIYMRDGSSAGLLDGYYSGLEFVKYDGVNNGRLAIDSYGVARVGDVGDEQPLATREESPLSNGYAYWDGLNKRFSTKLIPFSEITNKPTTLDGYGIIDGQPLDADLSAIASLIETSGLLRKTAANTWSLDTNIYLTAITKAQVEAVLTGDIATHTHSQYLTGNQTINISGDATGSGTTAIALTLVNSGVVAGTYNNSATQVIPFTVDTKGRITSVGTAVTITPDWVNITSKPTTLAGYGITDAIKNNGLTESYIPRYTSSGFVNSNIYDNGTDVIIGGSTSPSSPNSALNLERIDSNISRLALTNKYESTESSAIITFVTRDTIAGVNVLSGRIAAVSKVTTSNAPGLSINGNPNLYLSSNSTGFVNISIGTVEKININATNILVKAPIVSTYDITAPTFTGALIGNADSATKVNHALTFTGYSTGTFDGSAALSIAIPNNTNQLTNGAGYITSSSSITGNSSTATKLQTARSIAGVSFDGSANIDIPFANLSSKPTTLGGYGITDALPLSGGQLTGQLGLLQGTGGGIIFPNDSFGGSGDSASIKLLNPIGGESTEMTFTMTNDVDDIINFSVPSIDGVKINRYTVWNAGNFTNLNQLTTRNFSDLQNKPTTLSGYGITDALLASAYTANDVLAKIKTVDGNGSGLDADLLDGLNSSSFFRTSGGRKGNLNDTSTLVNNSTCYWGTEAVGAPSDYGVLMSISEAGWYNQLGFGTDARIYFRQSINSTTNFGNWNTLAFTTDNVASATKLQTARTIAGVSFDGTANISIPFANLSSIPTTLSGYGITDAYTTSSADNTFLKKSGGTMTGGIEIQNVLNGTSYAYGGGGYNPYYNNIILRGSSSVGSSGILFTSSKGTTGINQVSDRAFIQYHPYGVTLSAEGSLPTIETTGESGKLVIGVGNDADDMVYIQSPSTIGIKHIVGTSIYTMWDSGNFTNLNQLTTRNFSDLQNKPTTLSGYGITDALLSSSYTAADVLNKIKTVDGDGSGLDADTLDGTHYQNILERSQSGISSSGTATGWFRIASFLLDNGGGQDCILIINRSYKHASNETYKFSISAAYYGGINITQLSGYANTRLIDKIRVDYVNGGIAYIELHISTSTTTNAYRWSTVGGATSYTAWTAVSDTPNGISYEFTTVNGCKSDRGFTGDLSGNASTATKLQTTRTIWGQNFDGTGNVSGAMSAVTNITMSGALNGGTTSSFSSYSTANRFYAGYDSGATNSMSCSGWFRSSGNTGWGSDTYGGGIYMTDTTYVRVFNNKAFWVDNNIVATGEITAFGASDIRLKSNIKQIDSALDFLGKVKTYEFDWNEKAIALNPLKTKKGAGVIAQEMSLLDNNFVHSIYGDYLGVDYERFIPYLIGGVNEVNSKTITLGKRLDDTDSEVYKLKLRISELENKLRYYEHN